MDGGERDQHQRRRRRTSSAWAGPGCCGEPVARRARRTDRGRLRLRRRAVRAARGVGARSAASTSATSCTARTSTSALRLWLSGYGVGVVPAARVEHDYEFAKGDAQVVPARAEPLVDDPQRLSRRRCSCRSCRPCSRPSWRCSWSPPAAAGCGRSCERRRPCCASCRRSWSGGGGVQARRAVGARRAGEAPVGEPRQSLPRPRAAGSGRWRCCSAATGALSRPASRPAGGWARAPERGGTAESCDIAVVGRGHPRARHRARAACGAGPARAWWCWSASARSRSTRPDTTAA